MIFLEICLNGLPASNSSVIGPMHDAGWLSCLVLHCWRIDWSTEKSKTGLQKVDQGDIHNTWLDNFIASKWIQLYVLTI